MQVCTPSRDHRKKEKGTKLSARTIFSTMIELSSRFLTASPSTRCWDSYGTFVTPLKLGSLYAAGTWPYNAARRFSSTNFFPRVTVLRDLSVSRGSFRSFDEYFCECCFPFVSGLFIYAEILQLSGRRFGKDERYILHERFCFTFLFLDFCILYFFFKLIISWWLLKKYCSLWMYISIIHDEEEFRIAFTFLYWFSVFLVFYRFLSLLNLRFSNFKLV